MPEARAPQMRAMRMTEYGAPHDVLRLETVPRPAPAAGEVLLRVRAAAAHAGDWHLIRGTPFFVRLLFGRPTRPTIATPGCEVSGVVEAVGRGVAGVAVGDAVFGDLSGAGFGAFAEYVCAPAAAVVKVPEGVTHRQAAASCVSALAALQALRDVAKVREGQSVLVNGASGGVGSFAVQMGKAFGARVTAVCRKEKMEAMRRIGADEVVDYAETDVVAAEGRYDAVIDAACFRPPLDYAKILNKAGTYVAVGGGTGRFMQTMVFGGLMSVGRGVAIKALESKPKKEDFVAIAEMLEQGKIVPLIDRSYSLEEVADAIKYVEDRRVTGKVTIDIAR